MIPYLAFGNRQRLWLVPAYNQNILCQCQVWFLPRWDKVVLAQELIKQKRPRIISKASLLISKFQMVKRFVVRLVTRISNDLKNARFDDLKNPRFDLKMISNDLKNPRFDLKMISKTKMKGSQRKMKGKRK